MTQTNTIHKSRTPRYYGFRIYALAIMLYVMLVIPIFLVLLIQTAPDWIQERQNNQTENTEGQNSSFSLSVDTLEDGSTRQQLRSLGFTVRADSLSPIITDSLVKQVDSLATFNEDLNPESGLGDNLTTSDNKLDNAVSLLVRMLVLAFILGFVFNLPFKRYFNKRRKGKEITPKLFQWNKKLLLKTPLINALILFLPFAITLGYMLYILIFDNTFDEISRRVFIQFFFISVVSALLTAIFVYFWQNHRVHISYLHHIYNEQELRKRIFNIKVGKIRNRLWVSSGMTTLLPLIIVIFYLFLSTTTIKELGEINEQHIDVLFGKYIAYFGNTSLEGDFNKLFYINAIDSILMFFGIFSGIAISIIYILFFVTWTTENIVGPVTELLQNMKRTGQGELSQFTIVRTNDEIGVLSEGYNDMSQRIVDYFQSISRINEANSRFVPKQFLDFLSKENIADIKLGDQIQKEMTVLFTDIRDFTSISEEMTPKENFNFLNNYLGYMEPVIRNNQGFIDKFMGDSIMALFSERAEDAINAAIEMRIKLVEFNQVIQQFGKSPINTGIGIHTGNLMLGIVGGEGRMDGTVISDAVNLTARLEGLTKLYGGSIIISEDTLIQLTDPSQYNYRFLDIVKVKGKKEAVYIFEVLDGESFTQKKLKSQTKNSFAKALQYYKNQDFEDALKLFMEIHVINADDLAASLYIKRCKNFIKNGVPDKWDGIEIIDNK